TLLASYSRVTVPFTGHCQLPGVAAMGAGASGAGAVATAPGAVAAATGGASAGADGAGAPAAGAGAGAGSTLMGSTSRVSAVISPVVTGTARAPLARLSSSGGT